MACSSIAIKTLRATNWDKSPDGEHLLVAREGWQKNIAKWTTGRRVTHLGSFAAQGLDYYWVAGKSGN